MWMEKSRVSSLTWILELAKERVLFFVFVFSVTFRVRMVWFSIPSQTEPLERKFSFQLQYIVGSSKAHSPPKWSIWEVLKEKMEKWYIASQGPPTNQPRVTAANLMRSTNFSMRALILYSTDLLNKRICTWGQSHHHLFNATERIIQG